MEKKDNSRNSAFLIESTPTALFFAGHFDVRQFVAKLFVAATFRRGHFLLLQFPDLGTMTHSV